MAFIPAGGVFLKFRRFGKMTNLKAKEGPSMDGDPGTSPHPEMSEPDDPVPLNTWLVIARKPFGPAPASPLSIR
jgi:hypothetical protein